MGKANSYRQQLQLIERQYQSIEQQYHLYEQMGAHFFAISGSKFSSETMHAFDSLCDRLTNEYRLSPILLMVVIIIVMNRYTDCVRD